MTDIAVIILIGQEKIHLERCIKKLAALEPRQIFLVESQPDDGGVAIARETAAKYGLNLMSKYNKWPGLYAKQFNWALDNLPIKAEWVLRLDADEYLTLETTGRLKAVLSQDNPEITGYSLELGRTFWGSPVSKGVGRMWLGRVFRVGIGRCEDKQMDEHIVVSRGKIVPLEGGMFIDDNLNGPDWWKQKHRGYAKREAQDAISLFDGSDCSINRLRNPTPTDRKKIAYYKLPRYVRAVMYFCLRYFLKGGFLDGVAGWRWNFWQGLWYRCLVDYEIGKIRKHVLS